MFRKPTLLVFGLVLSAGVSAYAGSVNFSFDTQIINGITVTGLSSGATAAKIQTYMQNVLNAAGCLDCSVTVLSNNLGSGAVADRTWNGDGHVTGPGSGGTSLTLGDSNGATASNSNSIINSTPDTFIANTSDGGGTSNGAGGVTSQITLQFKGITGLSINSFDYEIFPDASCPVLNTNCGGSGNPNRPDLKLEAGNNTNGTDTLITTFYGVAPGTTNGNATHSPDSGSGGTELAPQKIGTWTGSLTSVSELDFVDWPATIGIDNLTISGSNVNGPNSVPEPASIAMFGTLVVLFAKRLRRA